MHPRSRARVLARADLPCPFQTVIPFLSLLVKDIHFLNEGCASRLPNGHVNFEVGPGAQGSARTSQLRQQECWPGHSSPQGQAGGSPHPHPPQETGAPTGEVLTGSTGRSAGARGGPQRRALSSRRKSMEGRRGTRDAHHGQLKCPVLQEAPGLPGRGRPCKTGGHPLVTLLQAQAPQSQARLLCSVPRAPTQAAQHTWL